MKRSLERRLDTIDTKMKPATTYKAFDPEEHARKGKWLGDTIERTCGSCPKQTPGDTGIATTTNLQLIRSCGHGPFWCKTFLDDILARAEIEEDENEKRELLKLRAFWIRGKLDEDS